MATASGKPFSCFAEREQASACLKNKWRKAVAFVPNTWYSIIRWLIKCLLKNADLKKLLTIVFVCSRILKSLRKQLRLFLENWTKRNVKFFLSFYQT
ncbi:hypothetical protein, partial [Heyndrickxia coagulans]|uniref:hypothetical protein n=1 Tax=Heyndrickxia coagulans TaxID=1398 RepID=UPI001F480F3E